MNSPGSGEPPIFSRLAPLWWDKGGPMRPLHDINPLRLHWIEEISSPVAGKKVCDIGCGGGILTESLARAGAEVTGIDANPEVIAVARAHAQAENLCIRYETLLAEDPALLLQEDFFDIVTCFEVLEHTGDPGKLIQDTAKLLRPGGWAFFSTLNRTAKSYLFAILGAEYLFRLLPRGTHDWKHFLRPSELGRLCQQAHLSPVALKGLLYLPGAGEARLTQDLSVNYFLAAQKE